MIGASKQMVLIVNRKEGESPKRLRHKNPEEEGKVSQRRNALDGALV